MTATHHGVIKPGHADISVNEVAALKHGAARLIDVREPHEYSGELGHVAHSELVPLATVNDAAAKWDREQPLVMICRSGARSGRAAAALAAMGFKSVHNMVGGMLAWNEAGLPTRR